MDFPSRSVEVTVTSPNKYSSRRKFNLKYNSTVLAPLQGHWEMLLKKFTKLAWIEPGWKWDTPQILNTAFMKKILLSSQYNQILPQYLHKSQLTWNGWIQKMFNHVLAAFSHFRSERKTMSVFLHVMFLQGRNSVLEQSPCKLYSDRLPQMYDIALFISQLHDPFRETKKQFLKQFMKF